MVCLMVRMACSTSRWRESITLVDDNLTINYFVKQPKSGISFMLFEWLPFQMLEHAVHTWSFSVPFTDIACTCHASLDHFRDRCLSGYRGPRLVQHTPVRAWLLCRAVVQITVMEEKCLVASPQKFVTSLLMRLLHLKPDVTRHPKYFAPSRILPCSQFWCLFGWFSCWLTECCTSIDVIPLLNAFPKCPVF